MRVLGFTIAIATLVVACAGFSAANGPDAGQDAGTLAPSTTDDGGARDSGLAAAFCASQTKALFCDDFESGTDLSVRWPVIDLGLGTGELIDGAAVGRSGKVLYLKATNVGGPGNNLFLRRPLGVEGPVRVAYDVRMNEWSQAAGTSTMLGGFVNHGTLRTWLSINPLDRNVSLFLYSGDPTFSATLGVGLGYVAPVARWEHYEVVVIPGNPAHFEWWLAMPPVKVAEKDVLLTFPGLGGFTPTVIEIGFTRANTTSPMPAVEGWFDNIIVTSL